MSRPAKSWTVWGIAELWCWLGHFPTRAPTGHDTEDCLQAHLDCGIDHVVWKLGRGAVEYETHHPLVSRIGDVCDPERLDPVSRRTLKAMREVCVLRSGLAFAHQHGMVLYGRLGMNRHYGPGQPYRSRFADAHPEYAEVRRDGTRDVSRLCYAIPEYRQERLAILCEAAELGVAGLQLDFCRQPPALLYHPALVEPFRQRRGVDPRGLTRADSAFRDWCQYRADVLTGFMREVRSAVRENERRLARRVPIQVRIPDDGFEANLIGGFDVQTWCREGLIDELALSALQWLDEYTVHSCAPYVELAHRYGIPVYSGSNCLPPQTGGWGGAVNPAGVNPLVLAQRALRDLAAGADGLALYQSDTGVDWPGMKESLGVLRTGEAMRAFAADPAVQARWPVTDANRCFGVDNHSRAPSYSCAAAAGAVAV